MYPPMLAFSSSELYSVGSWAGLNSKRAGFFLKVIREFTQLQVGMPKKFAKLAIGTFELPDRKKA